MGGDYSRRSFDPKKDYSGVLMQQGRVQLDSDWNEQGEIQHRRLAAETADIIGRCGVPAETPDGFKIEVQNEKLTIGRGRIYVDGLLAENHGALPLEFESVLAEEQGTLAVAYDEQPYFPNASIEAPLPENVGRHLIYLDVWSREVTVLEDPRLIEKAIGVDTTARHQTAWQVRFLTDVGEATCDTADDEVQGWLSLIQPSAGRLSTSVLAIPNDNDPCILPPGGGFRGLENQLYRVEIHDPGPLGTATFKWSRDNASVATVVTEIPAPDKLTLARTNWDSVRRFSAGDWVEITDDWREFAGKPGEIRRIESVDDQALTITLAAAIPLFPEAGGLDGSAPADRHTRIRRWDQKGKVRDSSGNEIEDVEAGNGVIAIPPANIEIVLEDGVQITFHLNTSLPLQEFRNGDYWVFAARTADASVEPLQQAPPRGVHHHYCRLAIVETTEGELTVLSDCRDVFIPLTDAIPSVPGIHVTDVRLLSQEATLQNDSDVIVSRLLGGVRIVCDQSVDALTINPATCSVTLDLPCTDQQLWGEVGTPPVLPSVIGFRPLILAAQATANGNLITWTPTSAAGAWLTGRLFQKMAQLQLGNRVLARVALDGNFIFSADSPALYLDGDTFGLRQSDNPHTALRLPSGDGIRGGEFRMWFWLVSDQIQPAVKLTSITLDPTTVAVGTSAQGLVTLSGPAPTGGFVVTLSSSVPAVASVPQSVTIAAGVISAGLQVTTHQVTTPTQVEITASSGTNSVKAVLTVQPLSLQVTAVRLLNVGNMPSTQTPVALAVMTSPNQTMAVPAQSQLNAIEVQISRPVDTASVVNGTSFIVISAGVNSNAPINGQIVFMPPNNIMRWVLGPTGAGQSLPRGSYIVSLKGTGSSMITAQGTPLDGEPVALPSGNGVPGGDFVFRFSVT